MLADVHCVLDSIGQSAWALAGYTSYRTNNLTLCCGTKSPRGLDRIIKSSSANFMLATWSERLRALMLLEMLVLEYCWCWNIAGVGILLVLVLEYPMMIK